MEAARVRASSNLLLGLFIIVIAWLQGFKQSQTIFDKALVVALPEARFRCLIGGQAEYRQTQSNTHLGSGKCRTTVDTNQWVQELHAGAAMVAGDIGD